MEVILILIGAALLVELIFLGAFVWAVKDGQYDDTYSPSARILHDKDDSSQSKSQHEDPWRESE